MLGRNTKRKSTKEAVMNSKPIKVAVVAVTLFASSALASSTTKKPIEKMTCEEFVGLEDNFKPNAVSWAIAYGANGKPESAGVRVERIQQIVPVVIEACQKTPRESFWRKVKGEFTKLRQRL